MTSMRETELFYDVADAPAQRTWLSVDVVAVTSDEPCGRVVLIERSNPPHAGKWTLPGGVLSSATGETVAEAAHRILVEKAGIRTDAPVIDVGVVSDRGRDERGHTVSIIVAMRLGSDIPGAVLPNNVPTDMPFNHNGILNTALTRIGNRLLTDPDTTYALLGSRTTVNNLLSLSRACGITDSDSTMRSRLDRSNLYVPTTDHEPRPGPGRSPIVYKQVSSA